MKNLKIVFIIIISFISSFAYAKTTEEIVADNCIEFLKAVYVGDAKKIKQLATEESAIFLIPQKPKKSTKSKKELDADFKKMMEDFEVDSVKINGDKAIVQFVLKKDREAMMNFNFVKINNEWRIDLLKEINEAKEEARKIDELKNK